MKLLIVVTPGAPLGLLRQTRRRTGKLCLLAFRRDSQALDRKKTEIKNLDVANVAEIKQNIDYIVFFRFPSANRQESVIRGPHVGLQTK